MRRAALSVLAGALLWLGCDSETEVADGGSSSSPAASGSSSAVPSGSAGGKSTCEALNEDVWRAIRQAPKACKTTDDCVIVGPAACRVGDTMKSCVAGVKKGYEGYIDGLSKKWEAAGCEEKLPEVGKEKLKCRAGKCTVVFKRR